MKKYLLYFSKLFLLFNFLFFNYNKAQVTIFQEDFESIPGGGKGTWQSGYFGTQTAYPYHDFYVQSTCAANLIAGTKSMQVTGIISNINAVCFYQNINQTNNPNFAPLIFHQINASNYNNITLSYKWKCRGESSKDYGRLMYSLDGNTWTVVTNNIRNNSGNTVDVTDLSLPLILENTTFYLGWSFVADANSINNPGLTVDDIFVKGTSICAPVSATASKYVICAGESVTLSAASATTGYTYTWYTDWDNDTHTGTLVGTGASVNVNPTTSILYGVVATKTGCPTGVNAAYQLITIAVTPAPTLVVLDPIEAITCSNELREINVVSGGNIPNEALDENWNPVKNPWTTNANVGTGGNANNALWYIYASGGIASPDNSNFAMVNSDTVGPYEMESNLVSSPISLLDYNTPINLTFNHYYSTYNSYPSFYSTATVEISEDGLNWDILKTYTGSDVGSPTNFATESINLNAYSGKPFLLLRFHYEGRYDDVWAIDDIKIIGSPKPTIITWSPTAGLFTDTLGTAYIGGHATSLYASPANTTTYTVSAKTAVGCPANATVTVERGDKIWQGTTVNWATAANWTENKVPTADHCVRIPSAAQIPTISVGTSAFAKNLTIQSGGELQIEGNLTVTDFVKNENGADKFVVSNDGNLVQVNDNADNIGDITVLRNSPMKKNNYTYWSSPVAGRQLAAFSPLTSTARFYEYIESTNLFKTVPKTDHFTPAKGYAIMAPATYTLTALQTFEGKFIGVPTNGTQFKTGAVSTVLEFPLALTDGEDQGYNLVGNPYPSNIDFETLHSLNSTKIYNTAYFWTNVDPNRPGSTNGTGNSYSGNAYAIYNGTGGVSSTGPAAAPNGGTVPTQYIKVGQGFIVKSKVNNQPLIFNNSIRNSTGNSAFFSKGAASDRDRFWLKLTTPAQNVNTILIGYVPGATNEFEWDYDAPLFSVASDSFYSLLNEDKLGIQGRSYPLNTQDIVTLGTKHFEEGNYIISLGDHEGIFAEGQAIYLKDKETGTITNLTEGGSYTFAIAKGEFTNRFEIIYEPQTVLATDGTVKEDLVIYRDGSDFMVKAQKKKISNLEVFDGTGRLILQLNPNSIKALIPANQLVNGVYVLKIEQGGKITTKKILK